MGHEATLELFVEGEARAIRTFEYKKGPIFATFEVEPKTNTVTDPTTKVATTTITYTKKAISKAMDSANVFGKLYTALVKKNKEPTIKYYDWADGNAFVLFDVYANDEKVPVPRNGSLKLKIKFQNKLEETVRLMMMCIYNDTIVFKPKRKIEWLRL